MPRCGTVSGCRRFLANLPPEELNCRSRLGFQFEQAFWFYEDFYRTAAPETLPRLSLKAFCTKLLQNCPLNLSVLGEDGVVGLIDEFHQYKSHVPTCGAIILNETLDKCLVVRGFSSKSTWGFPKGKIAKDELPSECAVREVHEETGFDISALLRDGDFLQVENSQQPIRLYIIPNVSEDTHFEPLTRREIRDIQWHRIRDIRYDQSGPHRYFNVMNFLGRLKAWIKNYRRLHHIRAAPGQSYDHDYDCDPSPSPPKLLGTDALLPPGRHPAELDPACRRLLERIERCMAPVQSPVLDTHALQRAFLSAYRRHGTA